GDPGAAPSPQGGEPVFLVVPKHPGPAAGNREEGRPGKTEEETMNKPESILVESHHLICAGAEPEKGRLKIRKLAGDASLRKYFRLAEGNETYALMLAEPFDPSAFDCLPVRDHLEGCGLPVPRVLAVDGGRGAVLL